MPELFGACLLGEPCCNRRTAISAMAHDFLGFRSGYVDSEDFGWAAIGTVSWHENDSTSIARRAKPTCCCAWIGSMPAESAAIEPAALARALSCNDLGHLQWLRPPFAAGVIDDRTRRLWILTDPYGLHPVYYTIQNGGLLFATKMPPLLRSPYVAWKLDPSAVFDFFTYEQLTGDRTFADTVKVIPPGTVLQFHDGRLELASYVRPEPSDTARPNSIHDTANRLYAGLSQSVKQSLPENSVVAVTLSGGMDSRMLLGLALTHNAQVRAYTFGLPGCRDVVFSQKVAHACEVPHRVVEVDGSHVFEWLDYGVYVTGGMVSCMHYHILSLAEIICAEADVVLDGLGGDAITGGHLKWTMVGSNNPDRAAKAVYRRHATAWRTAASRHALFHPDFLRLVSYDTTEAVRKHFQDLGGRRPWAGCQRFDSEERQRRFIQYGPHLLRPMVDVRTPFYSPDVIRLMSSVPASHLLEQRAYRIMYSKHLASLAAIPESARGIAISWASPVVFAKKVFDFTARTARRRLNQFMRVRKEGTTDYCGWFRDRLRADVVERLLDNRKNLDGIIQHRAIERVVREHLEGVMDHSVKLGCLLTFQAWHESVGA